MHPIGLPGAGLRVALGASRGVLPGWLRAGDGPGMDVNFTPGGPLALLDRSADVIACAVDLPALSRPRMVGTLLECRRVLRPAGVLCIAARQADVSAGEGGDLDRAASLVGLARAAPGPSGLDAALAHWWAVDAREPLRRWTKPGRQIDDVPAVSIAIPAYNPRFFAAALASAVAQSHPDVEIVVCDDSSDEAIERIVRAAGARRPVRYLRNASRLGVRANYRRCLEESRGEFLKFLCDDDVLAPHCVAALVAAFRRAPDITLVTSHRRRIDARGGTLPDQPATVAPVRRDAMLAGHALANAMIARGLNFVGEPSTVMFRRADLLDHAPHYFTFDGVHGYGIIDMITWASLLLKGDAVYLRESLSCFRVHAGQRQNDPGKRQRNIESIRKLQRAWQALGLATSMPPDHFLTKPFPPALRDPWRLVPPRSPSGRAVSEEIGTR